MGQAAQEKTCCLRHKRWQQTWWARAGIVHGIQQARLRSGQSLGALQVSQLINSLVDEAARVVGLHPHLARHVEGQRRASSSARGEREQALARRRYEGRHRLQGLPDWCWRVASLALLEEQAGFDGAGSHALQWVVSADLPILPLPELERRPLHAREEGLLVGLQHGSKLSLAGLGVGPAGQLADIGLGALF